MGKLKDSHNCISYCVNHSEVVDYGGVTESAGLSLQNNGHEIGHVFPGFTNSICAAFFILGFIGLTDSKDLYTHWCSHIVNAANGERSLKILKR